MNDRMGYQSLTNAAALACVTGPVAWLNGFHLIAAVMIGLGALLLLACFQAHPAGDPDV